MVLGWDGRPRSWIFTPAVYLQQRMMGVPPQRFRLDGWLYLALNGHVTHIDSVRCGMGWDEVRPAANDAAGDDGAQRGAARPARDIGGVHLIGHAPVGEDQAILLVRLDGWRASQQWTRWLARQIPQGQVHLMLDTNHYLPLCMPGYSTEYALRYFDPALARCHPDADGPC